MSNTNAQKQSYAIVIIGMLFFILGFVTWLNGTLIPFLKLTCQLQSDLLALLVTSAFYIAYVVLAWPAALVLEKVGYKNGMALSLLIMALGSLIFIPAAHSRSFGLFLFGLFVQAGGMTILQAASNPYISVLGSLDTAAKRMSIMGICNKIAGILSPLILSAIVLKNATALETRIKNTTDVVQKAALLSEMAARIIPPYIVMAGVLMVLAFLIKISKLPEINLDGMATQKDGTKSEKKSLADFPHLWLGALCIFLYVGVEVLAGDGIGTFGRASGLPLDVTKFFTSFTLGAMLVGYVIGIITVPKYMSQSTALKACAWSGLIFGAGILFLHGYAAITCIALLGLSNSLMWPAIWPLALEGLGSFTKRGSALLIMGIAGGALVPPLYGALKDKAGLPNNVAYCLCLLPCYAYILYYALRGHKVGQPALDQETGKSMETIGQTT
jgi:FHS family L-fucose permease-like MFS transporter